MGRDKLGLGMGMLMCGQGAERGVGRKETGGRLVGWDEPLQG